MCPFTCTQAVTEIFPNAKAYDRPPIDHGFYYDFHMDPISEEELKTIEKRMKELVKRNLAISREEYDNNELRSIFGDNKFKLEIMDDKIGHDIGFIDLSSGGIPRSLSWTSRSIHLSSKMVQAN